MRFLGTITILAALLGGFSPADAHADTAEDYWPNWRGPNSDGVAVSGNPPIEWSETKNVKWKVPIPGSGDSTPVVWGDKIFVTTAVPESAESPRATATPEPGRRGPPTVPAPSGNILFNLMCLNRGTGELIWQQTVRREIPHEGHHPDSSLASYSPVTDGELIWVSFGSRGLHCYDLDGKFIWNADLTTMHTRNGFGEGSSAALAGDAVVVVADHEGDSKIFAFNKRTGELLWEKDRDEPTSWATPLAIDVNGVTQVVTVATNYTRSYNAATGELIWQCSGMTVNSIPSPVVGFGNVYCASGYRGSALQAIEIGATGDVSESDTIVWEVNKDTPYVTSPLLYGDRIYVTRGLGPDISCFDAKTGKPIFERQKLEGIRQIYASPIGAADRVYVMGRRGTAKVLANSGKFEVLATNVLDDSFDGSPVVVGDELYLKGDHYLYCIAEK